MSSPAGAGGSGTGGSANVFLPPGQAGAASTLGNIIGPLAGMSANGGAGTPAAWAYPQSQSLVPQGSNLLQQYLTGSQTGAPTLFDQGSGLGYGSAVNAANLYSGGVGDIYGQIPGLAGAAGGGLSYLPQLLGSSFSPYYGQMTAAAADNPFYAGAMGGAQQGAGLGQAGAGALQNAGMGILQQGFDPQSALFGRTQRQLVDQSGVANAMAGIGSSPYGASATANALGNFDINWQNNLLGRQTQAAGAASPLLQAAPGLAYGSGQLPSQAYMGQIGNVLNALAAQNKGALGGAAGYGSLLSGAGQGLGQAQNLLGSTTGGLASSGMLPYQAGAGIANNALTGLGNQNSLLSGSTQLGNNQFVLPQQVMDDLMRYMGLGQSASQLSGNLGQMGYNQTGQGIAGLLSGGNALFGNNSLLGGSGGLFGGGGLFGSGGLGGLFGGGSSALPFGLLASDFGPLGAFAGL